MGVAPFTTPLSTGPNHCWNFNPSAWLKKKDVKMIIIFTPPKSWVQCVIKKNGCFKNPLIQWLNDPKIWLLKKVDPLMDVSSNKKTVHKNPSLRPWLLVVVVFFSMPRVLEKNDQQGMCLLAKVLPWKNIRILVKKWWSGNSAGDLFLSRENRDQPNDRW